MVNSNTRKLTEELLKVQIDAVDSAYIQDEFSNMQVDENKIAIIDQLIQVCNNVLDQIIMNMSTQIQPV